MKVAGKIHPLIPSPTLHSLWQRLPSSLRKHISRERGPSRIEAADSATNRNDALLDFARQFDRILCPFNGLYCLTNEADLIETLKRVREHLRPDGLFAFDVYDADDFPTDAPNGGDEVPELVATAEALGTTWDVFEASLWDRSEQRIDAVYTHVPHDGRPRVTALLVRGGPA